MAHNHGPNCDHDHDHDHEQEQEQEFQAPPEPTSEQLAFADAGFRQVPLGFDPVNSQLTTPSSAHDLTVLNALIRSLAALPPSMPVPPPPNAVPPQRSYAISKAKEDGNAAFKKGDLAEAIKMFTLAIDVGASRPLWENNQVARDEMAICLANRSAAFAQVGDWIGALCDADAIVKLKKPWSKGHYRKGKALAGLSRWADARDAYNMGLSFDPESVDLKAALAELPSQ